MKGQGQLTIDRINFMNKHMHPGSYKYVHILVSLRNTSFKIMVARNPNPVARKKTDILHNILFFCPAIGVSYHGVLHPRKFIAPSWLLKRSNSNAMLLIFILAFFVLIVLCLLILGFNITCFRPFPHAHKTKLTQTHFNGSGSALKLPVTH